MFKLPHQSTHVSKTKRPKGVADMKEIKLTQGRKAVVDNDDFDKLIVFKWCYLKTGCAGRGSRTNELSTRKTVLMHRQILQCPDGLFVDHKNGNRLDNRKSNLRICTKRENAYNVGLVSSNKSGYRGVSFDSRSGRWRARIRTVVAYKSLGYFSTAQGAAEAYNAEAINIHKEFHRSNS